MPRRILSLIAGAQLALLPCALFAEPRATGSDVARLIEIGGGRKLYLECKGTGSPVVILEAGLRNRADIWSVKPEAGEAVFSASCRLHQGLRLRPSRNDPRRRPVQP